MDILPAWLNDNKRFTFVANKGNAKRWTVENIFR